ncbi:hypothetical protein [Geminocystis sp. NIES-3709]|uniref:hypothetical protein n=1 Tax=Geminocystis sp. NIES-3709 TaxID=1617448 RepID=UPI0005FC8B75|nr:hypothetical protein [Geminocystis sp. NIES-3709]BAQ64019.1 hypothetical protein GM3709_784 [Geminocystis sp. NIES-3709]
MTKIRISGLRNDLEKIEQLIKENYKESNIKINTTISEYRADSIDIQQILPVLRCSFYGAGTVAQIMSIVLSIIKIQEAKINIQEMIRKKDVCESDKTTISLNISSSDGEQINLNIPSNITKAEKKKCIKLVENLTDKILVHKKTLLLQEDLEKTQQLMIIKSLLFDLKNRLKNIRKLIHLEYELKEQSIVIYEIKLEQINLLDFLLFSKTQSNYLVIEEVKHCQEIFGSLEKENLFAFIEISNQIKIIDNIGYVRYEVEKLNVFDKFKKEILSLISE